MPNSNYWWLPQVMQAEAAGIKPSVLMNPILLKPTNDVGSQVIVNGEVLDVYKRQEEDVILSHISVMRRKYFPYLEPQTV